MAVDSSVTTTVHDEPRQRKVAGSDGELSTRRLNVKRAGYAFMGVGLALVKWPVLFQNVQALPVLKWSSPAC
jgi:hypothetical protein